MTSTLLQILFYGLIPLGIFLLVIAIRLLRKSFYGAIMAEIPLTQRNVEVALPTAGHYGIWQKGRMLKRTLVDRFDLQLFDAATGTAVNLHTSVFAPHVNGFDTGRLEWKRFNTATGGLYKLCLIERTTSSVFERMLSNLFPNRPIDYSQYWLQVRESQPAYVMVFSIPLIILSVACIFGGLVLAINARQVAAYLGL